MQTNSRQYGLTIAINSDIFYASYANKELEIINETIETVISSSFMTYDDG